MSLHADDIDDAAEHIAVSDDVSKLVKLAHTTQEPSVIEWDGAIGKNYNGRIVGTIIFANKDECNCDYIIEAVDVI